MGSAYISCPLKLSEIPKYGQIPLRIADTGAFIFNIDNLQSRLYAELTQIQRLTFRLICSKLKRL